MDKTTTANDGSLALPKGQSEPGKATTPINLSPEQAAKRLNTSRWTIYKLMNSGDLASYHIGKLRRIPMEAVHSFQAAQLAKAKLATEAA